MLAVSRLCSALGARVPDTFLPIIEIDVDLQLAPADQAATVRNPDLVVVGRNEYERAVREGGIVQASGVRLAVEVLSPGSRRIDLVIKAGEYADAGIEHYWVLDLEPRPTLIEHRLVDGRYEVSPPATGMWRGDLLGLSLDLDALG